MLTGGAGTARYHPPPVGRPPGGTNAGNPTMATNSCWGIEIGAFAVKGIKLERDGDGIRVVDYSLIPHPRVLSEPGVEGQDVLRVSLGAFVAQNDLSGESVAVSVPGHSAFARFAKLPPVEPKKVPDIVKFEAVQQIPFSLDEVEWDFQTFQNPDTPDIEVGIFAITKQKIQQQLDLLADVGVTPDVVTLSPVAVYNALAFDLQFSEKTPGTIVLDVGTTSTDLVVAEAGRVWVRTFPLGGHQFTDALVNAFKLSYTKAEKLKREAEGSKHARHAFQAMRPVFGDLVQDVQRSIGYYQSLHPDAKLVRLIGLGSTFKLPGLRKFLKQQLQIDVYRMDQYKRLSVEGAGAGDFQSASLNIATAYGLALQGLGFETIQANLMPISVIRGAMWKKKVKWFGMAAGMGLAASGAMFVRPLLDSTAVARVPKPQSIDRTLADFNRLKKEASDAIASVAPDFTAAQMVGFVDGRDLYPRITDDIASMLADAQQKALASSDEKVAQFASAAPIMILKSLRTDYVGPTKAAAASAPPPYGLPPDPGTGTEPVESTDPYADNARVYVDVLIETTHPDPARFVFASIGEWLKNNADRTAAGYIIRPEKNYYTIGSGDPSGGVGGRNPVVDPWLNSRPPVGAGRTQFDPSRQPTGFGGNDPRSGQTGSKGGDPNTLAPLAAPAQPDATRTPIRLTLPFVIVGDEPKAAEGGDP